MFKIERKALREKIAEFLKKERELKTIDKSKQQPKKLTARERLGLLLDKGTFTEIDLFAKPRDAELQQLKCDGVVAGYGKIDGRQVCVYAQDFTQKGGTLGEMHAKKIVKVMDLAIKTGCPIIGIDDSGGARIQEGVKALDGYARIFYKNTNASGVVPQISIILGPCAGGAVYSPALTDFIFMVKGLSKMFITGPAVIKSTMSEEITPEMLGGAEVHAEMSGVAHFEDESEHAAILKVRRLLSYLPSNNLSDPPKSQARDNPNRRNKRLIKLVPSDPKKSYDVRDVLREVLDRNSFMEVHAGFAKNIIVGFARLNSTTIGVVANQPCVLAGCLDINASDKAARFVRFCDAFNIPIINFVDVPGYLPGKEQEYGGIIRHGAELLYAYAEATVPKISLIMRKAYGGAYIVLCSREMRYDQVIAWPTARIAVMGARQAAEIIFKDAPDKEEKTQEYEEKFLNPYVAAELGSVDMIINPAETRATLIKSLEALLTKRERRLPKKHGNIPL
jgi:acetyl-CoA carboxylase carboxyltransferase component